MSEVRGRREQQQVYLIAGCQPIQEICLSARINKQNKRPQTKWNCSISLEMNMRLDAGEGIRKKTAQVTAGG